MKPKLKTNYLKSTCDYAKKIKKCQVMNLAKQAHTRAFTHNIAHTVKDKITIVK